MNWYKAVICQSVGEAISQPYYRIVSPIFGTAHGLEDSTGTGSYWTPRWDSIVKMMQQLWMMYTPISLAKKGLKDDQAIARIYRIDNAIMEDAPKEHEWAFNYDTDVGEKVLVKALEPPQLVKEIDLDEKPHLSGIEEFLEQQTEKNIDYSQGYELIVNGDKVWLMPNYNNKTVEVAKKNTDGWSFSVVNTLRSLQEVSDFINRAEEDRSSNNAQDMMMYVPLDFGWTNELV